MLTLSEVKDFLKELDEFALVQILDLKSHDLVERFSEEIEDKLEELSKEFSDDDYQNPT